MAGTVAAVKTRVRGITKLAATFTTDASDGTVAITNIGSAYGRIVAVEYDPGSGGTAVATGADLVLSDSVGSALLTITDAGTTPRRVRPTCIPVVAAGTAVSPAAGYDGTKDIYVAGQLKLTVAAGGNAKVGVVNVIVADIEDQSN